MYAALDRLGLLYKAQVPCGVYTADAVLPSHTSKTEMVLMVEGCDELSKIHQAGDALQVKVWTVMV